LGGDKVSDIWITDDGSYGTGKVIIVKTDNWTEQDWLVFDNARDNDKIATAIEIGERYNEEL
jgi:hypothetical protein